MASLHRDPRSPFWQIQFKDKDGRRRMRSTGYRHDDPVQTAAAEKLRAEFALEEAQRAGDSARHGDHVDHWGFVTNWLDRYTRRTAERYAGAWAQIAAFCNDAGIRGPAGVRFHHGEDFVSWRTKRGASRNTAILDVKIFGAIVQEAVRRGLVQANPLVRLGLRRDTPKRKRALLPDEVDQLRRALAAEDAPEWMRDSFEIAAALGVRLRETAIPLECIDFDLASVTIPAPKGGEQRAFTIPLPAVLRPMFERMRAEGRKVTVEFPPVPSTHWRKFFHRNGFGNENVSFHSLRATKVTELALRGAPPAVARALVNHSSDLVHQTYQRLSLDHLRQWAEPAPAVAAKSGSPKAKPAPSASPRRGGSETPASQPKRAPGRKARPEPPPAGPA